MPVHVRPFEPSDTEATVAVWHAARRAAHAHLPAEQERTLADDRAFFTTHIVANNAVWVAEEAGHVLGYLALADTYLDRLYVRPDRQRRGIGRLLLDHAKTCSPQGLELHTHQVNAPARAFYEQHGFRAVAFGVSPPPESEPDVTYRWSPPA